MTARVTIRPLPSLLAWSGRPCRRGCRSYLPYYVGTTKRVGSGWSATRTFAKPASISSSLISGSRPPAAIFREPLLCRVHYAVVTVAVHAFGDVPQEVESRIGEAHVPVERDARAVRLLPERYGAGRPAGRLSGRPRRAPCPATTRAPPPARSWLRRRRAAARRCSIRCASHKP